MLWFDLLLSLHALHANYAMKVHVINAKCPGIVRTLEVPSDWKVLDLARAYDSTTSHCIRFRGTLLSGGKTLERSYILNGSTVEAVEEQISEDVHQLLQIYGISLLDELSKLSITQKAWLKLDGHDYGVLKEIGLMRGRAVPTYINATKKFITNGYSGFPMHHIESNPVAQYPFGDGNHTVDCSLYLVKLIK